MTRTGTLSGRAPAAPGSSPRRCGSATVAISHAMIKPGTPTRKKTDCHQCSAPTTGSTTGPMAAAACNAAPPAMSAKPLPQTKPMLSSDIAIGNLSRGKESVRIE